MSTHATETETNRSRKLESEAANMREGYRRVRRARDVLQRAGNSLDRTEMRGDAAAVWRMVDTCNEMLRDYGDVRREARRNGLR